MSSGQTSERLSARAKLLLLAAALSSCITRQGCVWQLAATVTHTWTATNMWTVTNLPRHYSVICVRVPSSNLHGITSYASHLIILPYPMTWFSTILPQSPGNPSLIPGSRKTAQWYSKALAAQRIQATVMKEATVMRTDSVRTMASPFRWGTWTHARPSWTTAFVGTLRRRSPSTLAWLGSGKFALCWATWQRKLPCLLRRQEVPWKLCVVMSDPQSLMWLTVAGGSAPKSRRVPLDSATGQSACVQSRPHMKDREAETASFTNTSSASHTAVALLAYFYKIASMMLPLGVR